MEAASGRPVGVPLKLANGSLRSLAASTDGSLFAAAVCKSTDQCDQIVIWDRLAGKPLELKTDFGSLELGIVSALAFSPDKQTLVLGNARGQIYTLDLASGEVDQAVTEGLNLQNVSLVTTSLAFGPEGSDLLAAGFHDGRVALWQSSTRGPIGQFDERMNGEVTALFFYKDETGSLKLAAGTNRGELRNMMLM